MTFSFKLKLLAALPRQDGKWVRWLSSASSAGADVDEVTTEIKRQQRQNAPDDRQRIFHIKNVIGQIGIAELEKAGFHMPPFGIAEKM